MNDNSGSEARRFIFTDDVYDAMGQIDNENNEASPIVPNVAKQNVNNIPYTNDGFSNQFSDVTNANNQENLENSNIDNINHEEEIKNILENNNQMDMPNQIQVENNPNNFFKNDFKETTTVYDNVGNTISQTVNDNGNITVTKEEPVKPIFEYDKEKPDLGIPTKDDIYIPTEVTPQDTLVDVPSINQTNINLDVQTGIDTNLENELISDKDEYVPQINFFDIDPLDQLKPDVSKYKAVRRTFNPIKLEADVDSDIEEEQELKEAMDQIKVDQTPTDNWEPEKKPTPIEITEEINYYEPVKDEKVTKSDLLVRLAEKEKETGKISILARYGDDFCSRDYITNPAIGREKEIKELGLILLTPEKSAILVGKPGIGKTSIVEGLAYQLQRDNVPDALKGYVIISVKTTSLLGATTNGETRLQTLIDELKGLDKIILFIDEVHMLMGATNESSLDFANMFKESLGRGSIKMIGATTSDEYERYVLRDKAFVRRFQRVDVNEPNREETIQILMGTLPKIEKTTGATLKYTYFIKTEIMAFIVDITTEYKRVYGIGSRYPDICITLLNQAFSEAVFNNRNEVNIFDIRSAIEHSKNIYPDVIRKELVNFDKKFKNIIDEENQNS